MKPTLNKDTLKNHFSYSWWKYLLVLILGIMGVSLLYTLSKPRIPDDRKLEVIICGASMEQDFNAYLERVRINQMQDMKLMEMTVIPDDETAIQYLTVRIGTQGGDIYILPKEHFEQMASSGALLPLEDDQELMEILEGVDLESGWSTEGNSREMHIYGIPLRTHPELLPQFSGLEQYFYVEDGYICLLHYGKNIENAKKFLRIMCQDTMSDISVLKGPRVSNIGLMIFGSIADSGFSEYMKLLLADKSDGNIRLQVSDQSDLSQLEKCFADRKINIFILPLYIFTPYAGDGYFLALENDELMQYLDPVDRDYWVINNKTGASSLYGIPLDQLPGLQQYFNVEDGVLCVRASDENAVNAMKIVRIICREMRQ